MITIEEIKNILNKKFPNNYQTINKISERTDKNNLKVPMIKSNFKAFNYDDVILKICSNKEKEQDSMCAVDAIDIQEDTIYFIEFKDGNVFSTSLREKYQVRLKMIESILQFINVLGLSSLKFKDFFDLRKVFILVYNEENAFKVKPPKKAKYLEQKILVQDQHKRIEEICNKYKYKLEKYKEAGIYSDIKLYNKETFEEEYIKKYSKV